MTALNILYFFLITFYSFKFLYASGVNMRHPFDRTQRVILEGPEALMVLIFSTGLLSLSGGNVGVDLMAVRLLVLEVLCILGLTVSRHRPVWSTALAVYVVYLVWLAIGCVYSPSASFGFRVILKYLYPFLLCLFASAAVRCPEVFYKAGKCAVGVAIASIVCAFVPGLGYLVPGVFWYGTARAINYISMMVFCLTMYYYTDQRRKYLWLTVLFILPCFLWVFRTSIMGSIVALSAFFFIRYRLRSLPILMGILVAGVIAVFTIPSLREKMFHGNNNMTLERFQNGKVTMDNVETNGREAMWEYMDKHFYEPHRLEGSGTGTVQHYMYTHFVFGGLKVPHSDFVQMRSDNGLIGLVLYCSIALFVFLHCLRVYHSTDDTPTQMCALAAGASILGVFVTCYSDNTVNYSMATLSMPWGFYGMMLGLLHQEEDIQDILTTEDLENDNSSNTLIQ